MEVFNAFPKGLHSIGEHVALLECEEQDLYTQLAASAMYCWYCLVAGDIGLE
jgi:hypothetical protein